MSFAGSPEISVTVPAGTRIAVVASSWHQQIMTLSLIHI